MAIEKKKQEDHKIVEATTYPRVKSYADKLSIDLRNRRFMQIGNWALVVILIIALIYSSSRGNVVVVGNNIVASGSSGHGLDDSQVTEIRADGQSRLLYGRLFTFDYNNFKQQKGNALYLGDRCIENVYLKLVAAKFYENIVDNHFSVVSYVDTTNVSMVGDRVRVFCKGRMELKNSAFLEIRKLDIDLLMVNAMMLKEKNPFGYSITSMELLSNAVLSRKELTLTE